MCLDYGMEEVYVCMYVTDRVDIREFVLKVRCVYIYIQSDACLENSYGWGCLGA